MEISRWSEPATDKKKVAKEGFATGETFELL